MSSVALSPKLEEEGEIIEDITDNGMAWSPFR
jgi:hypothetical protein